MALFAVAVLALRGLVAPGFMPDMERAARGEFRLVICTGTKALGQLPRETPADGQAVDELCSFAALGHLATLTEPVAETGAPRQPVIQSPTPSSLVAAPALPPLRARGPPHFRS